MPSVTFYLQTSPAQHDSASPSERAAWVRERLAARNALDEAEGQIAQLKAELEATRRDTAASTHGAVNGDVDMHQNKVTMSGLSLNARTHTVKE